MAETMATTKDVQLATFYVGDLLLGLPIEFVQEINHSLECTRIPRAPECVRGVINLRGKVTTLIDLRCILGLQPGNDSEESRYLIVRSADDWVGLYVDGISDIISIDHEEIATPPANLANTDGEFFEGVYRTESEIVAILDLERVLTSS